MTTTGAPLSLTLMEIGQSNKEAVFNSAISTINSSLGGGGPVSATTLAASQTFTLSGDISPTQIAANTDNYAPTGIATAGILRLSTDASRNLTGITTGADGRLLLLLNVGSFPLVLKDDATSTAANRFQLNSDVTLGPDEGALLWYDSTSLRWRLLAHYQSSALSGDVTSTSASNVTTIANDAVTYAKMQNVSATDKVLGRSTSGSGDVEEIACTAAGRALIDDADATAQRVTLGLVIGTNVQAYDAELAALAGLTSAADKLPYFTGSGTASLADLTTAGRALLNDATAGDQRTTLGLGTVAVLAAPSGTLVGTSDTQTLSNKRITKRVAILADSATISPSYNDADTWKHVNTQVSGTLTIDTPTGTPQDGDPHILRLKTTNAQTPAWGAAYRGSTDQALPTTFAAGTTYALFLYNGDDSKLDLLAVTKVF